MFGSIQICKVFGIPIRVHITLLIILPWLASSFAPAEGGSGMFWGMVGAVSLFASVALHELGHSITALRLGYKVRDITLWPIGGVAMMESMPTRARDELLITVAGPLVSLALGILGLATGPALLAAGFANTGRIFMLVVGALNIWLFLFNLIPAFPMDGGRILRAGLTPKFGRLDATRIAARIGRALALVYGVYSATHGNWLSVIIAIFVFNAAGQEYRMVQLQEMRKWNPSFDVWGRPMAPPPLPDVDVTVGPPPYRR
jgi:stage IV sporulation protein FB